jgi:acyl-CoA thioester hydrolase
MTAAASRRADSRGAGEEGAASLRGLADRANFTVWNMDTLRLSDLDHQNHVNNAVHAVLFTNGRFNFIQRNLRPHVAGVAPLALVKITIEYLNEMHHPGEVECGTLIRRVGRSSVTFGQALFNEGRCAAVAESTMVLLDPQTRRPKPLPPQAVAQLERFKPRDPD